MSAGLCWPSSSMVTIQSEIALDMPARVAACWPKLRDNQISLTKEYSVASSRITRAESSIAPSWTRMTSFTRYEISPWLFRV